MYEKVANPRSWAQKMTLHFILQSHCGVDWVPAGTTHFTKVTLQCWPPKLLVRTTYFAKVTLQCHPPKYWQNFAKVTLQCHPPKYRQGQHTLPKSHCSVDHLSTSRVLCQSTLPKSHCCVDRLSTGKDNTLCQSHTAVSTTQVPARTQHFAKVTLSTQTTGASTWGLLLIFVHSPWFFLFLTCNSNTIETKRLVEQQIKLTAVF